MPLILPSDPEIDLWAESKARLIIEIIARQNQGKTLEPGFRKSFDKYGNVLNHVTWDESHVLAVENALAKFGYDASVQMHSGRNPEVSVTFRSKYSFEISDEVRHNAERYVDALWKWICKKYARRTLGSGTKIIIQAGTGIVNIPVMVTQPGITKAMKEIFISKYSAHFCDIDFKSRKGSGGHDLVLVVN